MKDLNKIKNEIHKCIDNKVINNNLWDLARPVLVYNALELRHLSIMKSQITGNSTVC